MGTTQSYRNQIRGILDFPKKGINFKDFTPLLLNPEVRNQLVEEMIERAADLKPDIILGVESRGFVLGGILADRMHLPFAMARKRGKLPGATHSVKYQLEYGNAELEIHSGQIPEGSKVLIHDDLLATGGTAAAVGKLVVMSKSEVVGFSFIVELSFLNGRKILEDTYNTNVLSSVVYDS